MRIRFVVKGCREEKNQMSKKKSFLTVEEAGLVEMSGLSTHERFLCRLTVVKLKSCLSFTLVLSGLSNILDKYLFRYRR